MRQIQKAWGRFRPVHRMSAVSLGLPIPGNHGPRDRRLTHISDARTSDIYRSNRECATRPNPVVGCLLGFRERCTRRLASVLSEWLQANFPSRAIFRRFSFSSDKPRRPRGRPKNAPRAEIWPCAALLGIQRWAWHSGRRPGLIGFGRAPLNLALATARANRPNPTADWGSRDFANARPKGT